MARPSGTASLFTLLSLLLLRFGLGLEKHWQPDLEWRTRSNWVNGLVPETDSKVIFPLETRHAVGIAETGDLRLAEIDLPREGALALARDGKLQLSDANTGGIGRISRWRKEGYFFWADPNNWNFTSEAVPHLERVPCRSEDVVLPSTDHSLSMHLPIASVYVRSVRAANNREPFAKYQWQDLAEGRSFAGDSSSVRYSSLICSSCPCQPTVESGYLEEICAIERPRCGLQECEIPLNVEGHCCPYCGGRVVVSNKFSMQFMRAPIDELLEYYTGKISWHVRRRWDGESWEVLVKEKGDYTGLDAEEAVQNLQRILRDTDINDASAIVSIEEGYEVLKAETAGGALKDSRLVVTLVPFFGIPLIVFALLFLACSFFGYSYGQFLTACSEIWTSIHDGFASDGKRSSKYFSFARFENISEGNVRIADTTADEAEDQDEAGEKGVSGRFENPLYRSKREAPKSKNVTEENIIDLGSPLSLSTLQTRVEDNVEEVEMNIEK